MICDATRIERGDFQWCDREVHEDHLHIYDVETAWAKIWPVTPDPDDVKLARKLVRQMRKKLGYDN
jgi:hypothetical protein